VGARGLNLLSPIRCGSCLLWLVVRMIARCIDANHPLHLLFINADYRRPLLILLLDLLSFLNDLIDYSNSLVVLINIFLRSSIRCRCFPFILYGLDSIHLMVFATKVQQLARSS